VNNLFRLLGISLVISLLALPIDACKPWESAITLNMTVDTPQDGTTVGSSSIIVSGSVNKSAKVKINDVEVPIKGGKFSTDFKLTEGNNVINVGATSGKETLTKKLTITYTPSKQ
jgi:hypothetical protein